MRKPVLAAELAPDERTWLTKTRAARIARILGRCEQVGGSAADEARQLAADPGAELAMLEAWLSAP